MSAVDIPDIMAGDEDVISLVLSGNTVDEATGSLVAMTNLNDLVNAYLYLRKRGDSVNYVDGVEVSIVADSMVVTFDPRNNAADGGHAFRTGHEGGYDGYVRGVLSDGRPIRFEGIIVRIKPNYES